jgi:hypothetical protein
MARQGRKRGQIKGIAEYGAIKLRKNAINAIFGKNLCGKFSIHSPSPLTLCRRGPTVPPLFAAFRA